MKLLLKEKKISLDYEETLFKDLFAQRQGLMTVDEYIVHSMSWPLKAGIQRLNINLWHDINLGFVRRSEKSF